MIKIMLVDDEKLIREGLKILISLDEELEIVAEANSGEDAFEKYKDNDIDVILMDIRMPKSNGIDGIKLIKGFKREDPKILILTTFNDIEYINEAIKLGASGYLLKDSEVEAIIDGIKSAYSGNIVLNREVSDKLLTEKSFKKFNIEEFGITKREFEIIGFVASGLSNQEIADSLYLSLGTIKNSISSILDKLELRDRTQIVIFAYENKIV